MKLKRCRLTVKREDRRVELLVVEATARAAADLAGVNKTAAAYFYHHLRKTGLANRAFPTGDDLAHARCAAWNRLIDQPRRSRSLCTREWTQKAQYHPAVI